MKKVRIYFDILIDENTDEDIESSEYLSLDKDIIAEAKKQFDYALQDKEICADKSSGYEIIEA